MRVTVGMTERVTLPVAQARRAKERAQEAAERCDRFSVPVNGTLDPTPIIESLGCLRVRAGWRLVAYLQGNLDGDARVVALPPGFEPDAADDILFPVARLRKGADEGYAKYASDGTICVSLASTLDFMWAVDGDGSPWSYLCASLALRQLLDVAVFGRFVREHDWIEHRIVAGWPRDFREPLVRAGWRLPVLRPPTVISDYASVTVRFFTYHRPTMTSERVQVHEDIYRSGSYDPCFGRTNVAVGRGPAWLS